MVVRFIGTDRNEVEVFTCFFFVFVQDLLHTVFQNGKVVKNYTFDEVRDNAKLKDSELEELLHWMLPSQTPRHVLKPKRSRTPRYSPFHPSTSKMEAFAPQITKQKRSWKHKTPLKIFFFLNPNPNSKILRNF